MSEEMSEIEKNSMGLLLLEALEFYKNRDQIHKAIDELLERYKSQQKDTTEIELVKQLMALGDDILDMKYRSELAKMLRL